MLASVLLACVCILAAPGCTESDPTSGEQAEEARAPDNPGSTPPAPAALSEAALAKLQRFQRVIVQLDATVPCKYTSTGREPYVEEPPHMTAHFGSSPADIPDVKLRLPVTWEGTTFRVQGRYVSPTVVLEEMGTQTDGEETVDITGQVDPTCMKILWLKASNVEYAVMKSTGGPATGSERRVSFLIESGGIPRISASDELGWMYKLDGEEITAVTKLEYSDVFTSKSVGDDEGTIATDVTEKKTIGKLPTYGELHVKFYRLPK